MQLLVTGGAGFIGSNFIRYWLREHPEDSIVNYDVLTYAGNLENLKEIVDHPHYQFVKGDICDRERVFDLVKDVDTIVHFAAESHVDRSIKDSTPFLQTNVLGTGSLLDAAKEYHKRFHHVSTDEVFGSLAPDDLPFTEQTAYAPRSPYAASKAASDHLVRSYFFTHGVAVTISHCSNNYGSFQFPEKIFPLFISNLLEGKKVPVYGDGLQVRDWIHVDDHCRGIEAILLRGTVGESYCLGGKESEISNLALTKKLIALLGASEEQIEFVKDRPGHDRRYAIDHSKAMRELGWEPMIGLEQGLKQTIEWYRSHTDWVANCKNGEYQKYYLEHYRSSS